MNNHSNNVLNNYVHLCKEVSQLAKKYGRNPAEIAILIASKGHSLEELNPLIHAGHKLFGESRQQEAVQKIAHAPSNLEWHFIGTLQQNKVSKVINHFSLIHSVDTLELAKKISKCSQEQGISTKILLQVNTSGELSKHGLSSSAWQAGLEAIFCLPAIKIMGMMTMAPLHSGEATARECFARLRQFRDSLQLPHLELSMGMSQDYPWAIAEGATLLRIGSAIFHRP